MKKLRRTHRVTVTVTVTTMVNVVIAALFAGIILGSLWVALNDSVIQQGVHHVQH
jgi:hypothetical protein